MKQGNASADTVDAQCTTQTVWTVKCTHIISWTVTLIREKIVKVVVLSWGTIGCSRDILCKAKGITLIESTQIRRFSRWSGWGGWSLWSDTKSLKTSSRDHQAWVNSDQIVLLMARHEADPCEQRQDSRATLSQAKAKGNSNCSNESWTSPKTGRVTA